MERTPEHPSQPERRRPRHLADRSDFDTRFETYLDQYGSAWRAFLTLPDVDPADPGIFDLFDNSYVGSYRHDREHVLENVTEYASVRDQIRQIAANAGWPDLVVRIDVDDLWDVTQEILSTSSTTRTSTTSSANSPRTFSSTTNHLTPPKHRDTLRSRKAEPKASRKWSEILDILPKMHIMGTILKDGESEMPTMSGDVRRLGELIAQARAEKKISQRELGRRAAVPRSTVNRLEQGKIARPRLDLVTAIAQALDVAPNDFFVALGHPVNADLPGLEPYLRARFHQLSPEAITEIHDYLEDIARREGIDLEPPPAQIDEYA